MEGPVLDVRDLCVHRGDQCVVHDVSLQVPAGELVGVLGPNGGGKTTLLRAILGLLPISHGSVRLLGGDAAEVRVRRRLAYLPQGVVEVDPHFPATAYETVLMGRVGKRSLLGRFRKDDHVKAREAMEEVGVWHLRRRPIGRLSGGQRQRVFLAKALAQEPELLLLDEPTTGVDPEARADFYGLLRHLATGHRIAVLMVSHDPEGLRALADRMVVLEQRVCFDGTPEEYDDWAARAHLHAPEGPCTVEGP